MKNKIKFNVKGLTGDNLALIEDLNSRIEELPESVDREGVVAEIKSAFKGAFNDKGDMTIDFTKLNTLLGDDDRGIKSIIKKQGEDIEAMKALGLSTKAAPGFKEELDAKVNELAEMLKGRKGVGAVSLALKAPATMTLNNTVNGDAALPDELLESFSIGNFVPKRYSREYVFDIANRTTVAEITQFKTWLEEGSEQGAFALVAEGGLKPLVSFDLVRNYSEYEKVAAKTVYTEEFAKFRKEAYAIITRLINQKILRDYSAILTTRLLAAASPYVTSALNGQYVAPTDYHAIAAVAAQIEALNFMPNVLIMNPQDKWRIGMAQNTQGSFYLTIPMTSPTGETTLMGFTVRTSNKIPVGTFILGESGLWEVEEEALTIRMGYGLTVTGGTSNGGGNVTDVQGDLDHNRFRIIVETFFHSFIASNNAGSFVQASFSVVKAAVTKP